MPRSQQQPARPSKRQRTLFEYPSHFRSCSDSSRSVTDPPAHPATGPGSSSGSGALGVSVTPTGSEADGKPHIRLRSPEFPSTIGIDSNDPKRILSGTISNLNSPSGGAVNIGPGIASPSGSAIGIDPTWRTSLPRVPSRAKKRRAGVKETSLTGTDVLWTRRFRELSIDEDGKEKDEVVERKETAEWESSEGAVKHEVVNDDFDEVIDPSAQKTRLDGSGEAAPSVERTRSDKGRFFRMPSMYVQEIEQAIETVLREEWYLFTSRERKVLEIWRSHLSVPARNLFAKLFLRRDGWHGVEGLDEAFGVEMADIELVVEEMCQVEWNCLQTPGGPDRDQNAGPDSEHDDDEDNDLEFLTPRGQKYLCFLLMSTECIDTPGEAAKLLRMDQLRALAKKFMIKSYQAGSRDELVSALSRVGDTQSALFSHSVAAQSVQLGEQSNGALPSLKGKETCTLEEGRFEQDEIPGNCCLGLLPSSSSPQSSKSNRPRPKEPDPEKESPRQTVDQLLMQEILGLRGKCVKIQEGARKLFIRLLMIYYRLSSWSDEPLKTSILVRIGRQSFPKYPISRVPGVFVDRRQLLEFEKALKVKRQILDVFDNLGPKSGRAEYVAAANLFDHHIAAKWREEMALAAGTTEMMGLSGGLNEHQSAFLRRFTPAWVYTRISDKITQVFARLKMYGREHGLLTELLTQRLFHTGKRGKWYSRKALLEERYMAVIVLSEQEERLAAVAVVDARVDDSFEPQNQDLDGDGDRADDPNFAEEDEVLGPLQSVDDKVASPTVTISKRQKAAKAQELLRMWRFQALATCEQGLQDPLVAPVDHYDLQRRIERLERILKVPMRERHNFGYARLVFPERIKLWGVRVVCEGRDRAERAGKDGLRQTVFPASEGVGVDGAAISDLGRGRGKGLSSGPTMWLDPEVAAAAAVGDETGLSTLPIRNGSLPVCRVEQFCLYKFSAAEGWKGMHAESAIVRALFTILFYDILFPDGGSGPPGVISDVDVGERSVSGFGVKQELSPTPWPPPTEIPPGVFQSPYQPYPLDLMTPSFFPSRSAAILERLAEISAGKGREIAKRTWSRHAFEATSLVGVRWDDWTEETVLEIVGCWPPGGLAEVCGALARDYRGVGAGVPDLFLWRVDGEGGGTDPDGLTAGGGGHIRGPGTGKEKFAKGEIGQVMFVEVKSEADRLHDQRQRYWMDLLSSAGISVVLCDVHAEHVIRLL